jgi:mono/diheme cytochrome c family protein
MDMQDQPKYKTFRAGDKKFSPDGASVRAPVEGTVARQKGEYHDREDYLLTGKMGNSNAGGAVVQQASQSAQMLSMGASMTGNAAGGVPGAREAAATGGPDIFPITIDADALKSGQERFNIYCYVCHGATGEGDGMVVRRGYRKPPSYYEDRLQEGTTPAAHFFDVITNGWGAMPSYAEQIPAEDRWKIIAYIRALQLSRRLKLEELSPEDRAKAQSAINAAAQGAPGQGHAGSEEKH